MGLSNILKSDKDKADRKSSLSSNDSRAAADAAASGKLPAGTGPGTSGIPDPNASAQRSPVAANSGSLNNNTDRSVGQQGSTTASPAAAAASAGAASAAEGHQRGHGIRDASIPDVDAATHTQQHLDSVTHENVRHQEVEEVQRLRSLDRHVHHIQLHTQPIADTNVKDVVHHEKSVPVTNIAENHDSTKEDEAKFASLNTAQNTQTHQPKERTVVDLGEKVNETVHHHVSHVIQPVIELETVDRHHIATTIPTKHTIHEAPIIHKATEHEPISKADFIKMGGVLNSGIKHEDAGVLAKGNCSRTVDGVGEQLAKELNLSSNATSSPSTASPARAVAESSN